MAFEQLLGRAMWKCARSLALLALAALPQLGPLRAAMGSDSDTQAQLQELRAQNQALQDQLRHQQQLIDELSRKVANLQPDPAKTAPVSSPAPPAPEDKPSSFEGAFASALGKIHLSGEAGAGFFESQSHGQFPHDEFRIDEAKLFLEGPLWGDVYFYTELNLFERENPDINFRLGELYLDVENLSRLWNQEEQLNLRLGRMDIPFGEEYLTRDAIDNPLISHSIMDFWGVDEGLELYGSVKKLQYVVAVQNGSHAYNRDFNADKAVVARVGVDPTPWLHLSVSAMRTGNLDAQDDRLSALWLGSGFIRSIGSTNTTEFGANLLEGDVDVHFRGTSLKAAGGLLHYSDNDATGKNQRDVYYYSAQIVQPVYRGLYAAARWGQVFANHGFPITGNGNVQDYFSQELTQDLSLLSLGLGYRWSKQLVLKGEYSIEWGKEADGTPRNHENLFAIMAAFGF